MVHQARAISDQENLPRELGFLCSTFNQNGYSNRQICALNPPHIEETPRENPNLVSFLPFVGPTFK